jgi:uncharacterized protein YtpQ (UPF0354 family)
VNLADVLSDPKLTQEKLFSLYEAALKESFPMATINSYPPEKFEVSVPNRETFTIYMANLWVRIKDAPTEDRVEIFEYHLRAMTGVLATKQPEPRKEDIVPMIKDDRYLEFPGKKTSIVHEHLAGDIWIVYGLDSPDSIKSLMQESVEQLGLNPSDLRPLACDNLRRILPEIKLHGSGPSYLLTAGGDYVASILLLDEVWAVLEERVDGDFVAAVPSRDVLLFTGSRSKEGLEYLRRKAREIEQTGDHVISQTLLRRTQGTWKVFD